MERICATCSNKNDPESLFCRTCGAPLVATCKTCGTINELDAQFCSICGSYLEKPASAEEEVETAASQEPAKPTSQPASLPPKKPLETKKQAPQHPEPQKPIKKVVIQSVPIMPLQTREEKVHSALATIATILLCAFFVGVVVAIMYFLGFFS